MEPILAYRAFWHPESNTGRVYLKLHGGSIVHLEIDSPSELAALCDVLDRHAHVTWDAQTSMIATEWCTPGQRSATVHA